MCYYLADDIADILIFGNKINEFISNIRNGSYITSDGFLICKEGLYETKDGQESLKEFVPTKYFANDDRSIILFDWNNDDIDSSERFKKYTYDKNKFKEYTDVVHLPETNLLNIQCPYILNLKTRDKCGFLDIYNIKIDFNEPLWKPTDNKDKILNLYDVQKLSEFFDDYKKQLIIQYDILFDDEAKKYYWDIVKTNKNK